MEPTICVTVVTGALGAGKTTLLNRWLGAYARGDAAVIVNEFGDVGVDGELLAERVKELVELTGGCLCCTTQADLVRALLDLSTRDPAPRRVFIETSGVASPAGVVRSITRGPVSRRMRLDGVVTVLDATRLHRLGESLLMAEQAAYADVIVLSRSDAVIDEAARAEAVSLVTRYNPAAAVTWASRGAPIDEGDGDLDAILARRVDDVSAPWVFMRSDASSHEQGIESVSLTLDGAVDSDRFSEWVESQVALLGGRLMRMKGIVAVADVPVRVVLQGVADQVEVSFAAPWGDTAPKSRLVLIGYGLDRDALTSGFAGCASG
ncbi:MAG: GTP-binding protein [Polyangiales bacterium]